MDWAIDAAALQDISISNKLGTSELGSQWAVVLCSMVAVHLRLPTCSLLVVVIPVVVNN